MRSIGALLALSLGMAGAVQAADLSRPAPVPVKAPVYVEPVYNWTGFYLGAHIGGAWDREEATTVGATALAAAGTVTSGTKTGFLGGGQVGANYQFNSVVIGVEGDGSWTNTTTSASLVSPLIPTVTVGGSSTTNWYATATGRIGIAAGPALFYAKGGGAFENIQYTATISGTGLPLALPLSVANGSVNRTGWTAGAGIEYGFAPNWSGKIEYDYMDFGTQRTTFNFIGLPAGISDVRSTVSVVKAGINYRFGPGPVTARY